MVTIKIKKFGTITVELDYDNAPNTCLNFVSLAKSHYYDGLTFHRVIKGFMIQGGNDCKGGPHYSIKGEFRSNGFPNNLKHERGVISMARTYIKDSAGAQFFIMHQNAPHLDGEYAAFGRVTSGMDVVDKIANVETDYNDEPLKPVVIESITVENEREGEVEKIL